MPLLQSVYRSKNVFGANEDMNVTSMRITDAANDGVVIAWNASDQLAIDAAVANDSIQIGATTATDVNFNGATAGRDVFFDASANTLRALDNAVLAAGSGDDLALSHDGTNSTINNITGTLSIDSVGALAVESSTGAISLGADAVAQAVNIATGAAARVITVGNAASASMALDAGVGGFALLADTTVEIDAGTALTIESSGGAISIGADAVAQNINVGTGGASRTITVGNTTGSTLLQLQSGSGGVDLNLAAPFTHSTGFLVPCFHSGVHQSISGAGAANLTTSYTRWTTTGADAGTLAAPGAAVPPGFIKKIMLASDGGDLTLTVTGLAAANDVYVFSELGQSLTLMATNSTTWVIVGETGGDTTVDTMPAFS